MSTLVTTNLKNEASASNNIVLNADGTVSLDGAFSGDIDFDSGTLYVDATNNRVGLGTSSPVTTLDVRGDASVDYNASHALRFYNEGRTNWSSITNTIASPSTTANLVFKSGSGTMVMDHAGNVGIGSTSPVRELQLGDNTSAAEIISLQTTTTGKGSIYFGDNAATSSEYAGMLRYDHADNSMQVWTSSTERARIDSSGRLLVGTSSAGSFNSGGTERTPRVQFYGDSTDNGSVSITRTQTLPLLFMNAGASGTNVTNNDGLGRILFTGYHTSAYYEGAYIEAFVDGTPGADDMPGRLVFSTTPDNSATPVERLRIVNDGSALFYATGSIATYIASSRSASTNNSLISGRHSATSTLNGTASFVVYTNGNVVNTNNSYGQLTSDERFKQDIVDAPSQWDDIKGVKLKKYRWKSDPTGDLLLGPIAQELQAVSPGLVNTRIATAEDVPASGGLVAEGDEVLSFKASILYMKAVGALQEAMKRIEALEASNADLVARVTALEGN